MLSVGETVDTQKREGPGDGPEVPLLQGWAEEFLSPEETVTATPKVAGGRPGRGEGRPLLSPGRGVW